MPANERKYIFSERRRQPGEYVYGDDGLPLSEPCWAVRVWLPHPVGRIFLGRYDTEEKARQVLSHWLRAGGSATRHLPDGIMPKWVVRAKPAGYKAVIRLDRGRFTAFESPVYESPEEAHLAALQRWVFTGWKQASRSASPYRLLLG